MVAVKKVELIDERGATVWSDAAGADQPCDPTLPAGGKLSVSDALSAPDWSKIPGGRWEAHAKKVQPGITLTLGTADRTVEKKAIAPAMIEPAVPP